MKPLVLALMTSLGLVACQKKTVEPARPADLEAAFGQEVKLHYEQQVRLPSAAQPLLTVRMTALDYAYCPAGANCFVPNFAWPTLRITDARGQEQDIRLPLHAEAAQRLNLLDTTSVVAAGHRYAVVYSRWELERALNGSEMPVKADFGLWLRLTEVRP
ncbi:hypothetical protein LJ737_21645 [Hymenobacter sp. 15J16-1T3B]|uniref:hypothetical protein n=1 Tax=Hymenobacter sp. 15J16-1T3B TaxID=2886941 RepID=UPI001D116FC3|nr:hypothetical protein [Hymenobacter sp. 15J16-1T3B]MCC3159861.1 hypothetical protein [Hymenobacter sp. 15J16-1T3B]